MTEHDGPDAVAEARRTRAAQPSPCIGLCRIDPGHGYCVGCFRSLDEICNWLSLREAERADVVHRCEKRRERIGSQESSE